VGTEQAQSKEGWAAEGWRAARVNFARSTEVAALLPLERLSRDAGYSEIGSADVEDLIAHIHRKWILREREGKS
jgi:hypothetical protein